MRRALFGATLLSVVVGAVAPTAGLGGVVPAAVPAVAVKNAAFDVIEGEKAVGWSMSGKLLKAAKGVGHNGSPGLVWESAEPSDVQSGAAQNIVLEPGEIYRFSALVRTENLKMERGTAAICIEWYDAKGKWMAGDYSKTFRDANADWLQIEGVTRAIPQGAARVTLQLYVSKGASGKVCFDNVTVTPVSRPAVAFVFSSAYRGLAASGPVRFHAALFPKRGLKLDDHQRCIVDGKPFFPLGMYSGKVTKDWIDTYAKGPFN